MTAKDAFGWVATAANALAPAPTGDRSWSQWLAAVGELSVDLYRLAQSVDDRLAVLAKSTPITGVVLSVKEVSGRAVITLHPTMGPAAEDPNSTEEIRTAWLTDAAGSGVAERARALIGTECRFGKWYEEIDSGQNKGRKIRMCAWIEAITPQHRESRVATHDSPQEPTTATKPPVEDRVPRSTLGVAGMRNLRPATSGDLEALVAEHLNHVSPSVLRATAHEFLGPTNGLPRTPVQLAKLWNHLVTTYADGGA